MFDLREVNTNSVPVITNLKQTMDNAESDNTVTTTITTTTTTAQWTSTMVVVAAVVGMLVLLVWWLCCHCSRLLQLKRVVAAEKAVLFQFLSNPQSLLLVHPYTTEIREKPTEEEEGSILKEFDWVEKLPFTVVSVGHMRSDPATSTIVVDIKPAGGGLLGVQLKWCLKTGHTETSELQTNPQPVHTQSTHLQESDLPKDNETTTAVSDLLDKETTGDESANNRTTTVRDLSDDETAKVLRNSPGNNTSPALDGSEDDKSTKTHIKSTDSSEVACTELYNHILVSGPRIIVVIVMAMSLRPIQTAFMDNLQQYFKKLSQSED